jgi:hypothetical protein
MNKTSKQKTPYPLIPENGSVVIIDDQPAEAMPIIKALSKKGISSTYYTGERQELPLMPNQNVRLLFLDLQLMENSDPRTIATMIVNVLKRVIPDKNGPYLLVIWSKKSNIYGQTVVQEIKKHKDIAPACVLNFDKNECIQSVDRLHVDSDRILEKIGELLEGVINDEDLQKVEVAVTTALLEEKIREFEAKENAVDTIEKFLRDGLEAAGCFHLFVIWENIVKRAAAEMVNDISSIAEMNDHWEINIKNVLKRMGIARVGRNQVGMPLLIEESINTLNTSLLDTLEHKIKDVSMPDYINLHDPVVLVRETNNTIYKIIKDDSDNQFIKNNAILYKNEKYESLVKTVQKDTKMDKTDIQVGSEMFAEYKAIPFKLNTKLHIELNPSQELIPGNIYFNLETKKKSIYLQTFLTKRTGVENDYFLIDLEVSPICDYAQDKWKRSRTLPGLLYPVNSEDKVRDAAGNLYTVEPTFIIRNKEYKMIFDFHLFNAFDKKYAGTRKVEYRLKRELLMDIIANLSSHVNRPGISFII